MDVLGYQRPQFLQPRAGEAETIRAQTGVDPFQLATSGALKIGADIRDPLRLKPLKIPVSLAPLSKGEVNLPRQYKLTYPVWKNIPMEKQREMFKRYASSVP
jgi:hypothetical protein